MDEQERAQLSALVDNELGTEEAVPLLEKIKTHPHLKTTWKNYQLISGILQNSRSLEWTAQEYEGDPSYSEQTQVVLQTPPSEQDRKEKKA